MLRHVDRQKDQRHFFNQKYQLEPQGPVMQHNRVIGGNCLPVKSDGNILASHCRPFCRLCSMVIEIDPAIEAQRIT